MIPVGAFDRVEGSAGDSDPGSMNPDLFPRLPDPIWAPIGRNNLVAYYDTTIEVSVFWMHVTRTLLLIPSAGLTGSGKPTKPATGSPDSLPIPTLLVSGRNPSSSVVPP